MDDLTQSIIGFENDFPRAFLDVEDASFGAMFYNAENPTSHDSNHAIIKDYSDFEATLETIKEFYRAKNLIPRIYGSYRNTEPSDLVERLGKAGFVYESADKNTVFMVWRGDCRINVSEALRFRRLTAIPEGFIESVYDEDDFGEGIEGVLRKKKCFEKTVQCRDVHVLAGFLGENAVCAATLQFNEKGFSRVDSVETGTKFRNRGYARQLAKYFTRYFQSLGGKTLYLYSSNPTAIKIYEEAGFEIIPFPEGWSAHVHE